MIRYSRYFKKVSASSLPNSYPHNYTFLNQANLSLFIPKSSKYFLSDFESGSSLKTSPSFSITLDNSSNGSDSNFNIEHTSSPPTSSTPGSTFLLGFGVAGLLALIGSFEITDDLLPFSTVEAESSKKNKPISETHAEIEEKLIEVMSVLENAFLNNPDRVPTICDEFFNKYGFHSEVFNLKLVYLLTNRRFSEAHQAVDEYIGENHPPLIRGVAMLLKATVYFTTARYSSAMKTIDEYLALPEEAHVKAEPWDSRLIYSQCARFSGNPDQGVPYLEYIINNPKAERKYQVEAFRRLAQTYLEMKEAKKSLDVIQKGLKKYPKDSILTAELGLVTLAQHDDPATMDGRILDECIEICNSALETAEGHEKFFPYFALARIKFVQAFLTQDDVVDAQDAILNGPLALLTEAMGCVDENRMDPIDVTNQLQLMGQCFYFLGDTGTAMQCFGSSLDVKFNIGIFQQFVDCCLSIGKIAEAENYIVLLLTEHSKKNRILQDEEEYQIRKLHRLLLFSQHKNDELEKASDYMVRRWGNRASIDIEEQNDQVRMSLEMARKSIQ